MLFLCWVQDRVRTTEFDNTMITALLILVCAVVVLGWLIACIALVCTFVSMIARLLDRPSTSREDRLSPEERCQAADTQFLHDVGIRL